jgi:hypothetical protein
MSHQSLINAKPEPIPTHPPTFPARPIRGGKLELAPKKPGIWFAEPKYNGWRALVHTPTGAMWNRHGQRLTIEREFDAALDQLVPLAADGLVWADCEALERRHQIGRGSLVVLDWIPESGSPTYEERREFLAGLVETECLSTGEWQSFPENALLLLPSVRDEGSAVPDFYVGLTAINRRLRCDFFEGVVMKRGNAPYPMQLRSQTEKCRAAIKHRFVN